MAHIIKHVVSETGAKYELLVNSGSEEYLIRMLDAMSDDDVQHFYITDTVPGGAITSMQQAL